MLRAWIRFGTAFAVSGLLSGCLTHWFEQREPWRDEAEAKCLAEGLVAASDTIRPVAIEGYGACGMTQPFKVSALANGFVAVKPEATLACPVIPQLQAWLTETIQPAAMRWFNQPVIELTQMSSYSCRPRNGQAGNKVSEHAFGNALDIGSFKLADGHVITVKGAWSGGTAEERGFLREVEGGACSRFTTVLGPGSNAFHYDHFHVDLARRQSRDICNPGVLPTGPSPSDLIARRPGGPRLGAATDPTPTGSVFARVVKTDDPPPPLPPVRPGSIRPIDEAAPGGRLAARHSRHRLTQPRRRRPQGAPCADRRAAGFSERVPGEEGTGDREWFAPAAGHGASGTDRGARSSGSICLRGRRRDERRGLERRGDAGCELSQPHSQRPGIVAVQRRIRRRRNPEGGSTVVSPRSGGFL